MIHNYNSYYDVLYNYSQVGSYEMRLKWRTCEKIPAFSKQTHSM